MNNSPFKIKEQIIVREFNRDSPYRQRLSRKRTLVGNKFFKGYQKQLNIVTNRSKGNSNKRQIALKKKCNQNFFINGNKLNPIFKQSISRKKNRKESVRQTNLYNGNTIENQQNDIQQKRFQIRCVNNDNNKVQNSINNFQIKSSKDKKIQQKFLYKNFKLKSQFKDTLSKQINDGQVIKETQQDFNDYKLYSKNISIEDFKKIWQNFKTTKISLEGSFNEDDLELEYNEDLFYGVLVNSNQECEILERIVPSGIVIWNYEYKNIRVNQIVISHLFLLKETPEKIKKFLNLISEKIFNEQIFQAHEIVFRIKHQNIDNQLIPPNKEFIKSLKLMQWRWKMVLNLHKKRYTVMYKKNPDKNQRLIFSVNMNYFSLISQQDNMLSFGKQKKRPLQIYETFQEFIQNLLNNENKKNQCLPIYKQKTKKKVILNDQELKNYISNINKDLCSKDKNLKNLCFQNELQKESLLFEFSHILRIHPNTTRKEIINNKQTKISRLPYIYKKQNEQFYFIDTLDPSIKVIVIKYQQKYKDENKFQNTVINACDELEKIQTRTIQFDTKGYLWLPNFKISQNLEKINFKNDTMNFKKCYIEFNQNLPINKILISPDPSDKRLKGEFIFGICQANLKIGKFQPLSFFKVTRKDFIC